ncbi:MAG: c-type cytochrome, partial [Chloroflexota bacterium]
LNAELEGYRADLVSPDLTEERRAFILERREEITERISGEGGIREQVASLEEQKQALADSLQSAVDNGYPLTVNAEGEIEVVSSRLEQIDWGSTLYDFTFTTLVHGRPTSISYWEGNQMVAWSQRAGGPLRDDQIDDLTNFILNWDRGDAWTIEDALAVRQYAIIPGAGGGEATVTADPAGSDVQTIITQMQEQGITGDPVRGQAIYENRERSELGSRLGCSGCHGAGAGPATEETWASIDDRLQSPELQGYTPEQYTIESIVQPGAYIVEGWGANMPADFGQRMSLQDIADVMIYLRSYSDADHSDSWLQEGSGDTGGDEGEGETEEPAEGEESANAGG